MKLAQILELVGPLDDAPGDATARVRFRGYLADSVTTIGAVRDYVQECLQTSGPQYNRALQDLVNHAARLIGFEVEFGRYAGVQGEVGFDGIWRSGELAVVVEVKTTDAFATKTATLLNYINALVSTQRIQSPDSALGLYVVGRIDPELKQLENAIIAEKRIQQLRLVTIESVLSMAELIQDGFISKDEALGLLRPGTVVVDDAVRLIARVASMSSDADSAVGAEPGTTPSTPPGPQQQVRDAASVAAVGHPIHLMTPIADNEQGTIRETLEQLLGRGWYVFGKGTPSRKDLQPGDRICFYATTLGVVAEAEVASPPELGTVEGVRYDPERFPWRFRVKDGRFFYDEPVVIDAELRSGLDAFGGRDPARSWAWFVQSTRRVSRRDFARLTRRSDT